MTNITDLPTEVVEAIVDVNALESPTYKNDLTNLRRTCKYLGAVLAPRVLHTIALNFCNWGSVEHLIQISTKPSCAHTAAKSLKIKCLAPATPKRVDRYEEFGQSIPMIRDPTRSMPIVILYLSKVLSYFHNLESVEWSTHTFDIKGTNQLVMDMLYSQPRLRSVRIDMGNGLAPPYPELGRLSKLSNLSFSFPPTDKDHMCLVSGLTQVLHNSPDLTNLQIKFTDQSGPQEEFDEMYKQIASLHNVRKLSLCGAVNPCLESFATFCNMSHLTSLEIGRNSEGTEFERVWRALRERGIHLANISFSMLDMEMEFVRYLTSYSGVKELWLSDEERYGVRLPSNSDGTDLATAFHDAIAKHHADTLQVLDIYHEDKWNAWGERVPELRNKLMRLHALRKLRLMLPRSEWEAVAGSDDYRWLRNLLKAKADPPSWWES